jgi:hypothetical protein
MQFYFISLDNTVRKILSSFVLEKEMDDINVLYPLFHLGSVSDGGRGRKRKEKCDIRIICFSTQFFYFIIITFEGDIERREDEVKLLYKLYKNFV